MLFQFGLTATVAILVSMLVSFSLTPMMCSRLLRPVPGASGQPASRRGFYAWLERGYAACLGWSMRHRYLVLAVSVAVVALNIPLYRYVQKDYIPTNVDEAEFEVRVTAPEGITLRAMDRAMQAVEAEIAAVTGVTDVLATVGSVSILGVNTGYVYVRLADIEKRRFSLGRLLRQTLAGRPLAAFRGNYTQAEKMQEIRRRLNRLPDLRVAVRNLTSFRQGAPVDIDFSITGPDLQQLAAFSEALRQKAAEIPGIVDTDITLRLNKPELHTEIDRQRAAALGVDVQEIADTQRVAIGGDDRASRYRDPKLDDVYDVELHLVGADRGTRESISQLYVRARPEAAQPVAGQQAAGTNPGQAAPSPALTRLDSLVRFRHARSAARIDRLDRERMAAVRANVAPGFALADRIEALQAAADALGMPPEYSTRVMGRGRELERTLRDFGFTFVLSFIFMYIVLAAQFEHLLHPLTILFSLPLAVPFGLVSLVLGGETLNLYSAVGILVLFGIIKKASILQVDHTNQLRARGLPRLDAIMLANRDRLRPILMTTVAFVAGMLPLLLGVGPGAEERRSIAVLTVGGQTLSLLLTLVAVPVVYSFLDDLSQGVKRYLSAKAVPQPPAQAEPAAPESLAAEVAPQPMSTAPSAARA